MKKELEEYIILLQKEVLVEEKILKFLGHKLKQVQQLHGNILVVFYKEIIQLENFILLQLQIIFKKQILEQK